MRGGYIEDIRVAYYRDDLPEPQLEKPTDVKIRVRACGICGSEVHAYLGEHPFRIPPLVSGHEVAGDVVAVGEAVTAVKVGDRVVVEPQYGCGECWYCKHHLYNVCTAKKVLGSGGWSGGLGEFIVTPEQTVISLANALSYEEGALIETVANAIAEGKMDLSKFVTQRYPIEQFKEAMYMADKRPEPVLKVMVHF